MAVFVGERESRASLLGQRADFQSFLAANRTIFSESPR
jgi:hypothetical protein